MSDLVKRLLAQANKEANELADMLNDAADRIEALEAALRQAQVALDCAIKHHTTTSLPMAIERFGSREAAQCFGILTWQEYIPNAISTINDLLNDTQPSGQTAA